MGRGLRNLIFTVDTPPVFSALSVALFVASIIVFWCWMSFVSALPPAPCNLTETLIHFRSSTLCATSAQATYWARERCIWQGLFASSFVVRWSGIAYRKLMSTRPEHLR